jgi:hypothetical protein
LSGSAGAEENVVADALRGAKVYGRALLLMRQLTAGACVRRTRNADDGVLVCGALAR